MMHHRPDHCGIYVPTSDELEGVERFETIPDKDVLTEVHTVFQLGDELKLPKGTPHVPQGYPPYPGATLRWAKRTQNQVDKIKRKAPGIVCATYLNHGRTGEKWGIDIMVSRFNVLANAAQENLGDQLSHWLLQNWDEMHLNYIIWWNWMNDGAGWFDYEPYRRQWGGGSQNPVTSKHKDHVHAQIMNPSLGPTQ